MKIILASQSPRRREILTLMEIPFEVIESHVQEIPPEGATPEELVKALAEQKARAVFSLHPQDCVIGAVTWTAGCWASPTPRNGPGNTCICCRAGTTSYTPAFAC